MPSAKLGAYKRVVPIQCLLVAEAVEKAGRVCRLSYAPASAT